MMINKSYIFLLVMVISSCGLFNKENNFESNRLTGVYSLLQKTDSIHLKIIDKNSGDMTLNNPNTYFTYYCSEHSEYIKIISKTNPSMFNIGDSVIAIRAEIDTNCSGIHVLPIFEMIGREYNFSQLESRVSHAYIADVIKL